MPSIKVKLTKPIQVFDKRFAEVELKEPIGSQYVMWGDPRTLVFNAGAPAFVSSSPLSPAEAAQLFRDPPPRGCRRQTRLPSPRPHAICH